MMEKQEVVLAKKRLEKQELQKAMAEKRGRWRNR